MLHTVLHVGLSLYALNLVVGLVARTGKIRFGRAHHALYALVFLAAGAAWWHTRALPLGITLAALALMPLAPARSALHPALAAVGLVGYLGAYVSLSPWS